MSNVAATVRANKEAHPELYCPDPRCLWRIVTSRGPNPCRKHPARPVCPINLEQFIRETLDGAIGDSTIATQEDALAAVVRGLELRARRTLTSSERVPVSLTVALESNRRGLPSAASWFHTSDGRYFANDGDRRQHQRTLEEKAKRDAERRARVEQEQLHASTQGVA